MKTLRLTKAAAAVAVFGLAAGWSASALAAPTCPETNDPGSDYKCVFFNTGTDFNGNGSTTTSSFFELGYNSTLATSIYRPNASGVFGVGSQIIDTNKTNVLNAFGLVGGPSNYTTLGGTTRSLKDTPDMPGEKNIDTLSGPSAGQDQNAFNASNQPLSVAPGGPFGWGLTYEYFLTGQLAANGPVFTGGFFDIFFQNWALGTSTQVLRVNVTGSQLDITNLMLLGVATFDWAGGGTDVFGNNLGDGTNDCAIGSLCASFFNFQTTLPTEFFALEGAGIDISFMLDSNVNPPIPTSNQLVAFNGAQGPSAIRQTTLDGSIRFNVPEPGSLALVGLSLAALGWVGARRKRA